MKKIIYTIIGSIALALGTVGTVLPVLPTVPFFMLAAFCFAKSSQKLHNWFTATKLYRDNLADFVAGKGMTVKTKVRIMVTVTILMTVGFIAMHQIVIGQIVLSCVWMLHVLYFVFGIKTLKVENAVPQAN